MAKMRLRSSMGWVAATGFAAFISAPSCAGQDMGLPDRTKSLVDVIRAAGIVLALPGFVTRMPGNVH
jgi:UPF0716 family protein affecting phage T7 exclusion